MKASIQLGKALFLAAIASVALTCQTAGGALASPDPQATAWSGVLAAEDAAAKLGKNSAAAKAAYADAATKLRRYIDTWLRDPSSTGYLEAQFRLGLTLEAMGDAEEALSVFKKCKTHSRLNDARWGDKPLAPLLQQRLATTGASVYLKGLGQQGK